MSFLHHIWPALLSLGAALPAAYAQKEGLLPALPRAAGYALGAVIVLALLLLEWYAIRRGMRWGLPTCTWPCAVLMGYFPLLGLGDGGLLPALAVGFLLIKAGFAVFSRLKTGSCKGYNPCIWISMDSDLCLLAAAYAFR